MPRTVEIQSDKVEIQSDKFKNLPVAEFKLNDIINKNENLPECCYFTGRLNIKLRILYIYTGRVLFDKYLYKGARVISISLRMFDSYESVVIKIPGVPGRISAKKN